MTRSLYRLKYRFPAYRSLKRRPQNTNFGQTGPANTTINNKSVTTIPQIPVPPNYVLTSRIETCKHKFNILTNRSTNIKHNLALHVWQMQLRKAMLRNRRCKQHRYCVCVCFSYTAFQTADRSNAGPQTQRLDKWAQQTQS